MTVAEMMEALSKMPQDARLVTISDEGDLISPSWPSMDEVTMTDRARSLKLGQEIVII